MTSDFAQTARKLAGPHNIYCDTRSHYLEHPRCNCGWKSQAAVIEAALRDVDAAAEKRGETSGRRCRWRDGPYGHECGGTPTVIWCNKHSKGVQLAAEARGAARAALTGEDEKKKCCCMDGTTPDPIIDCPIHGEDAPAED